MKNKRAIFGIVKGIGIGIGIILGIVILLAVGGYFIYMNLPGEPEDINLGIEELPKIENQSLESVEVSQFYPNMKFNHNSISYKIDIACNQEQEQRVVEAFDEISTKVGLIDFSPVSSAPDIEVSCSEYTKESQQQDYFIAGEGGSKEIIQTGRYNIISNGIILLYENPYGHYKCDWPNIELHELMHVFGFDHSQNENSLMYAYLKSCDQTMDDEIVDRLKQLYSEENLADLYFEEVNVIKKGIYLDFDLKIKNSGAIDAQDTSFSVLDDGKLAETFALDDIKYGAGIAIEIKNLKLNSRNPDEIKFVIDKENLIQEIDEDNNVAVSTPE